MGSSHGVPEMSPVQVGARLHEYTAGSYAAAAALTAWRAARLGDEPVVVDLSIIECLVGTLAYPNLVMEDMLAAGLPPPMARHFPLPGIVRCRDGWVGINVLTAQHFMDVCAMTGLDEYASRQPELAAGGALLDEFYARLAPWLLARDAAEIVELSQAFRVPVAPVGDGRMLVDYAGVSRAPVFRHRRRDDARPAVPAERDAGRAGPVVHPTSAPSGCSARQPGAGPPPAGDRGVALRRAARRRPRHLLGRALLHDVSGRARRRRDQGRVDVPTRRLPLRARCPRWATTGTSGAGCSPAPT